MAAQGIGTRQHRGNPHVLLETAAEVPAKSKSTQYGPPRLPIGHYSRDPTTSGDITLKISEELLSRMPILSGNAAGRTVEPIEPQRFSLRHQTLTHTDNPIEWLNRELRCRPHVVGSFPDDNSALMLFCIRLRHVAGT